MTGGQNLTAALGYAETMALADRSTLTGEAGVLFETALKAAPQNPKALWYGGMSAAAKGEMDVATDRWRRLLDQDLPEPVRQVVQQQLASLGDPIAAMPAETTQAGSSLVIAVQITVAEHLRERIDQSAALFIVARDPDQAGPPIAVVRQLAGSLPTTINITDANLMLPGRSLADLPRLRLIARVARGGDPIAQPGDIYGEILWDAANHTDVPVAIVIDSVFE
jgi:cytochrome c-type biogenesis protein CcmH